MQHWTKAVLFGAVSTAAIAATLAWSPDSGFAGGIFVYNVTFFFPLVIVSFACWVTAVLFYIFFICRDIHRTPLKIVLPVLLLLAFPYQLTVIALGLVQLSHLPPPPN